MKKLTNTFIEDMLSGKDLIPGENGYNGVPAEIEYDILIPFDNFK